MKCKYKIYMLMLWLMPGATACSDWLNVTPSAQMNEKTMFETPQGFRDHLMGIYISMTGTPLYGCDLTYGFMDVLAQYYTLHANTNHEYYEASGYNYKNEKIQERIKNIWAGSYNVIANCNLLLENLYRKNDLFFPGIDGRLLEAEALALRAFLHFDLLRAYAPAYGFDGAKQAIPYADQFTSSVFPTSSVREVTVRIITDLEKAKELLKGYDPVLEDAYKLTKNHFDDLQYYDNIFISYRGFRMNYYAVVATLARVYLYMGEQEKAYAYAVEVIKAGKEGFFTFTLESELSATLTNRDIVMQNEIIFALSDVNIHKIYNTFNMNGNKAFEIFQMTNLYPVATDFRRTYLMNQNTRNANISLKYADIASVKGGKIPMIRLSEMYYIASEAGFEKHKETVVPLFNQICVQRGITTPVGEVSYSDFTDKILQEVRREFLGEGQAFYWFKRLNKPVYRGNTPLVLSTDNYNLPIPVAEDEFRKY